LGSKERERGVQRKREREKEARVLISLQGCRHLNDVTAFH
jgi:hypothetical protein